MGQLSEFTLDNTDTQSRIGDIERTDEPRRQMRSQTGFDLGQLRWRTVRRKDDALIAFEQSGQAME